MARFFLSRSSIRDRRGTVVGAELEHLRRVLRLRPGDHIIAFDDAGWEHEAVIHALHEEQGEIEILRSYQVERESPLAVTLAVALTKGETMDYVVEKATELGVQTIAPFVSLYTVPKLDDRKGLRRAERWQKIALSAVKQCGRTHLPTILGLCDYRDLIINGASGALKLLFWEKEAEQTLKQVHTTAARVPSVCLVIGPEGGFSVEEAQLAREHGYSTVHLGRRVLRAETAAVAVVSLVQYLWGDLG
jgi:16S rRNA (uracil1498-N3)-methyltransferase